MNIHTLEKQINLAKEVLAEKELLLDVSNRFQIASLNSFRHHLSA